MKFEMSANEAGRHMSMTALTPQEDPESKVGFRQTCITTVIPIREEFRCRRAWFFYHDIRALVTSWLPLPIFLVWKIFSSLYILIWLILHIASRSEEYGIRWLIYITDLAFLLLTIGLLAMTILTIWYTILYYCFHDKLKPYHACLIGTPKEIYSQDNIPWFAKLCWALYIIAVSLVPLIIAGYWILVYKPCPSEATLNGTNGSMNMTDDLPARNIGNRGGCTVLDVYSIHFHAINLVIVLADLFLSRIPFQFMHFFYPLFFIVPYLTFTIIYWAAGGLNPLSSENFIYKALHYGVTALAPVYVIGLIIVTMIVYLLMFLVAWLRDLISTHISCCFRDMVTREHVEKKSDIERNGQEISTL